MDENQNLENETEQMITETDAETASETEPEQPKEKTRLPFWLGILVGVAACCVASVILLVVFGIRLNQTASSTTTASSSADAEDTSALSLDTYTTKLNTMMTYIDRYFIYDVDQSTMEESLADGLVAGLQDKYAQYYTAEEMQELSESVSGTYAGIGVSIVMEEDTGKIMVYKVFEGTPAEEQGIHVGDYIVEADGVSEFETLDDLVAVVRGEIGTTVDIVIERDGERIPLTVERADIATQTVAYEMLDNNIGYIYIAEFDTVTVDQFNEALDDLTEQGMESLILDLRDNPGGDYDAVVAMADRVLPEGPIMTVKDKNGTIKTENSDAENCIDIPMSVIINGNSASASEVFVGAIQDYDMATIVGEQSFGKGIVQSVFKLYDGSGIKFTTEEYFTPSGDSIHGVGITPDVVVELPEEAYDDGVITEEEDTQLQAAIEALTK